MASEEDRRIFQSLTTDALYMGAMPWSVFRVFLVGFAAILTLTSQVPWQVRFGLALVLVGLGCVTSFAYRRDPHAVEVFLSERRHPASYADRPEGIRGRSSTIQSVRSGPWTP